MKNLERKSPHRQMQAYGRDRTRDGRTHPSGGITQIWGGGLPTCLMLATSLDLINFGKEYIEIVALFLQNVLE